MIVTEIDKNLIRRKVNVLNQEDIIKIQKDVEEELKNNLCPSVPPYQTYPNLYPRHQKKSHWKNLYNIITEFSEDRKLKQSWVNLSKSNNNFAFHTHNVDLTCVYYLKNKYPEYGTRLENNIIIEAIENTIVSFKGKIPHSVANMPKEIAENNPRYSIVFNFNKI